MNTLLWLLLLTVSTGCDLTHTVLYIDPNSTALGPNGCPESPYLSISDALTYINQTSGFTLVLVWKSPQATYSYSYANPISSLTIQGNQQTLSLDSLTSLTAGGNLTFTNLTLQISASSQFATFVSNIVVFDHVVSLGSQFSWISSHSGLAVIQSCEIQSNVLPLIVSGNFGARVSINDTIVRSSTGGVINFSPLAISTTASVFQLTNSQFLGGAAPTLSMTIDTSIFGDTYQGNQANVIQVFNCTWKSLSSAVMGVSTWFFTASFDHCSVISNAAGLVVSVQTRLLSVTNSIFQSNTGTGLNLPIVGNPTILTLTQMLIIDQSAFIGNGQGVSIGSGQSVSQANITRSQFISNGGLSINGGCLSVSTVFVFLSELYFQGCVGYYGPAIYLADTANYIIYGVDIWNTTGADGVGLFANNGGGVVSYLTGHNLVSAANILYTLSGESTSFRHVTLNNCTAGKQIMNGYLNQWDIQSLYLRDCIADDMLLYYTGTTEELDIKDSIFYNSIAKSIHLHPGGTIVKFTNCTFDFPRYSETVLLINTGELTGMYNCTLRGSFRTIFSGLLAELQFVLIDSFVLDANIEGMFDGNYFNSYVNNTVFSNVTISKSSIVFLFKVNFYMFNVTFSGLKGNILNLSKSVVVMDNVTITDYETYENDQLIEASETNITITNFAITNFIGLTDNSLFSLSESSQLNMTNCTFSNLSQTQNDGLNYASETNVTFINVIFDNWNVTLFDAELSGFWFINCSFTRGGSGSPMSQTVQYNGGLVNGMHISNVWMENTVIANIGALSGGVLYLEYLIPTQPTLQNVNLYNTFVVSLNTTFTNMSALADGGTFYISEGSATLYNSSFVNSTAGEDGGFFNFLCNPQLTQYLCNYNLTDIDMINSSAGRDGGGIKYNRMQPIMTNVNKDNNMATYGPFIAGYPVRVGFINNATLMEVTPYPITETSGQQIVTHVYFGLYDHRSVLISTDSSSRLAVTTHLASVLLSGLVSMQAKNGVFLLESITVISPPGSTQALYMVSDVIDYVNVDPNTGFFSEQTPLTYILRNCTTGEILKGEECYQCEKGSYSFTTADTLCQKCKPGMICNGGANVTIERNYWRPTPQSDQVFECYIDGMCLGGSGVDCAEGYIGRLCTVCASNWFRYGRHKCSQCGDLVTSIVQGVFIILGVACFLAFIIYSSLTNVGSNRKSELSVQLRILINFVQVMMLMNNFQIVWPGVLSSYFDGLFVSGNASQMAFSTECYSSEGAVKYLYQKLIMMTGIPIGITGLSVLCWGIVSICKRDRKYITQHCINTMCVLLLTVHPMILQAAGLMLTCRDMENSTSWLVADLTIQCWVGEHFMFTTMMAVPALVLWCIGIPLTFYVFLVLNRKKLTQPAVARRFAFLYSGYQPNSFYWEFIVVVRKSYFVLVSNLLSSYNIDVQSYTGLLGLAFFLLIQNIKKPFSSRKLNVMESYSLIASIVTLICGMLYDTTLGTNEVTYYIMVAIVIGINANFLLRCLLSVYQKVTESLTKKWPKLGRLFCISKKSAYSVTHNVDLPESRFSVPEIKDVPE